MKMKQKWFSYMVVVMGMGAILMATVPATSYADNDRRYERKQHKEDRRYDRKRHQREHYRHRREHRREYRRDHYSDRYRHYYPRHRQEHRVIHRTPRHYHPKHRVRRYRNVIVVRPYGRWYSGYGHYHHDHHAFRWLAFTAITLKILDNLNEQQQREHEAAQIKAVTAPVGERIIWKKGSASGYVTTTREGTSTSGRYCREFQQQVTINGKTEQAYGTACRNPDGSWEVLSSGNR